MPAGNLRPVDAACFYPVIQLKTRPDRVEDGELVMHLVLEQNLA
jgi:hypothetical protein